MAAIPVREGVAYVTGAVFVFPALLTFCTAAGGRREWDHNPEHAAALFGLTVSVQLDGSPKTG